MAVNRTRNARSSPMSAPASGKRPRRDGGRVYVPKRELVRGLVTAIENRRLKVAKGLVKLSMRCLPGSLFSPQ